MAVVMGVVVMGVVVMITTMTMTMTTMTIKGDSFKRAGFEPLTEPYCIWRSIRQMAGCVWRRPCG